MFRILCSGLTCLLLLSSLTFAQNGKALNLDECLKMALKNNAQLKIATYQVNRAGADVKASYSSILPSITSSFSSGRSTVGQTTNLLNIQQFEPVTLTDNTGNPVLLQVPQFDQQSGQPVVDRVQSTSPSRSFWGHTMTLNYNQRLFDFGRSWNQIRQSKASFNSQSQSLTRERNNVFAVVKQRYFELLKAVKLEDEYRLAVERSKGQLDKTNSMFEIGSVAKIDVYRQEVILGTDEINLIRQGTILKIAQGNLNVTLGRDPEEDINIADVSGAEAKLEVTLDEAITAAEQNNPDLRSFEYDMKAAEYGRKAAKGRFLPSLGFGVTYQRNNDDLNRVYGSFSENFFVNVGAQVDFNIFNGLTDAADVQRQSANYNIAQENWTFQRRTITLQVKQAHLNLQAFQKISEINQRNLRSSEEDFRLAEERYRVGAGTQLEVTDAQVALTRARVNLVSSKYDALIAKAQLEAAMGNIDRNL